MQRVIVYIDGFNLYYGLRAAGLQRYYWLDLRRFASGCSPIQRVVLQVLQLMALDEADGRLGFAVGRRAAEAVDVLR